MSLSFFSTQTDLNLNCNDVHSVDNPYARHVVSAYVVLALSHANVPEGDIRYT